MVIIDRVRTVDIYFGRGSDKKQRGKTNGKKCKSSEIAYLQTPYLTGRNQRLEHHSKHCCQRNTPTPSQLHGLISSRYTHRRPPSPAPVQRSTPVLLGGKVRRYLSELLCSPEIRPYLVCFDEASTRSRLVNQSAMLQIIISLQTFCLPDRFQRSQVVDVRSRAIRKEINIPGSCLGQAEARNSFLRTQVKEQEVLDRLKG